MRKSQLPTTGARIIGFMPTQRRAALDWWLNPYRKDPRFIVVVGWIGMPVLLLIGTLSVARALTAGEGVGWFLAALCAAGLLNQILAVVRYRAAFRSNGRPRPAD